MPDGATASTSKAFWQERAAEASVELPAVTQQLANVRAPPLRVSRVAQLDSELLDRELLAILQDPVTKALQDFHPNFEPELNAILRFIVLRLALYEGGSSYGAKLQNLRYRDERRYEGGQKSSPIVYPPSTMQFNVYSLLTILPPYLHGRARDSMLSHGWADYPVPRPTLQLLFPRLFGKPRDSDPERDAARRRRELRRWTWDLLSRAEKLWQIASLANFLVFLYDGRYRTLIDRMLRMRLTYAQRTVTRNVSFEFLNRQLVWEAFTEFLLFLMPLINLRKLRLRVTRILGRSTAAQLALAHIPVTVRRALHLPDPIGAKQATGGKSDRSFGPLHHLDRNTCAICYSTSQAPPTSVPHSLDPADPANSNSGLAAFTQGASIDTDVKVPYAVDCCGALYCYFCIVGRMVAYEIDEHAGLAETGWPCLRCAKGVQTVERYQGDVVNDPTHGDEVSDAAS